MWGADSGRSIFHRRDQGRLLGNMHELALSIKTSHSASGFHLRN